MPESDISTGGIADDNGEAVQRFAMTMHNLGLSRAAEELVGMLKSDRWRKWSQGGLTFHFLPGEFDYFLSQQDIHREEVMAIPDVDAKSVLEAAMDERRTGQEGYRRPIAVVRAELPELPGRPVAAYGYSRREAEASSQESGLIAGHRPALGSGVRRYTNSGGTVRTRDPGPRWKRLAGSVTRLPDSELELVKQSIDEELAHRRSIADHTAGEKP